MELDTALIETANGTLRVSFACTFLSGFLNSFELQGHRTTHPEPMFSFHSESLSKHKFQVANLTEEHYIVLALMIQHSAKKRHIQSLPLA